MDKIQVLGSNYQAQLLSQIPKENLPKIFGGDCDCEGGCLFSDAGPWQPKPGPTPTPTVTATAPSPSPAPEPIPTTIVPPAATPTQS